MSAAKFITWEIQANGCWNCTSHKKDAYGYPKIRRSSNGLPVHRYLFMELFGNIPSTIVVRHKCDNRQCINPEHWEQGTQLDNILDKVIRGRVAKGTSHGMSKLDDDKVRSILSNSSKSVRELAEMYNVSTHIIYQVKNRKGWRHVQI